RRQLRDLVADRLPHRRLRPGRQRPLAVPTVRRPVPDHVIDEACAALGTDGFLELAVMVAQFTGMGRLFSALGLIFGMLAEKFDHIATLTTFVITPLVFVGGVFTSIQFLPPLVQRISLFNPMFHMIDAFRYSYTGRGDAPLTLSLTVVVVLAAVALGTALAMTAQGVKLRA
ncbi:MAG: ABC transporter permease, partial [Candidatus Velthaea sp.]